MPFVFTDFTIGDGVLRANESFDYEELTLYNITIFAFDGKTTAKTEVIVNILPVNEFDPVVTTNKIVYNVTEDDRLTICVNVSATHKAQK